MTVISSVALVQAVARVGAREHADLAERDLVGEPAGDRLLHLDPHGRGERIGLRREHEPAQAAAELGQADPLARAGQQQLPDQLVDVVAEYAARGDLPRAPASMRNG